MYTVVLLTEDALGREDAAYLRGLREEEPVAYHVLVPSDIGWTLAGSLLGGLASGELRATVGSLAHEPGGGEEPARAEAGDALEASLAALRAVGAVADGEVVAADPVPALREAVARLGADEVQVVTRPHVVEESVRRDWTSRARRELGVPVLHVYADTGGWIA